MSEQMAAAGMSRRSAPITIDIESRPLDVGVSAADLGAVTT